LPVLLDTSVAIALLDGAPSVIERRRDEDEPAFLSMISWVELIPGVYSDKKLNRGRGGFLAAFLEQVEVLPFAEPEVDAYERIIAANGYSRRLVVDRMIAATALANDLSLATLNPRDVRNIPGLAVEDWS
jgi:predicted nucleic acid-binding protein